MNIVRNYLLSARLMAKASGRTSAGVLLDILRVRSSYGIGPRMFCYFSVDGKQPLDWSEYIDHQKFNPVQRRLNPPEARLWAEDKFRFYQRCQAAGLPVPRVWGVIANQETDARHEAPRLHTAEDWRALQAESGLREFFLKPSHGAHGDGAFVASITPDGFRFADHRGEVAELVRYALERLPAGNSYLVQTRLRNAKAMLPIMSSEGLGTIRLVTVMMQGVLHEVGACLRISAEQSITDNFRAGLSVNLLAPVDMASGRLGKALRSIDENWPDMRSIDTHPTTGHAISDFVLPGWPDIRQIARRAHEEFAEMGAIGWDIAITDDGPVIIEANHSWSLNLLQLAHRQGFRSRLESIIGPLAEVLP